MRSWRLTYSFLESCFMRVGKVHPEVTSVFVRVVRRMGRVGRAVREAVGAAAAGPSAVPGSMAAAGAGAGPSIMVATVAGDGL